MPPVPKSVHEDQLLAQSVERNVRECCPGGANQLSPALQRWERWNERLKSRRSLCHSLEESVSQLKGSTKSGSSTPGSAAKRRKNAAHGASRGLEGVVRASPEGAKES